MRSLGSVKVYKDKYSYLPTGDQSMGHFVFGMYAVRISGNQPVLL
jgi:hypothetical protein